MPPRFTIDRLPADQFQFVIDAINNGGTDRAICAAFEKEFGAPLAKSSLARWRKASGDELAQQYRLSRHQTNQLLERLQMPDADKFDLVIDTVEDRLLTTMHQVTTKSPLKLLEIRQKEGERRLRQQRLELKEKELALKGEWARSVESPPPDCWRIAVEIWTFILLWLKDREPELVAILFRHTTEMREALKGYLRERFPI